MTVEDLSQLASAAIAILQRKQAGGDTLHLSSTGDAHEPFKALGYAHFDPVAAVAEFRLLFEVQRGSGLLPYFRTGTRHHPGVSTARTAGIAAPPLHGRLLWEIYRLIEDKKAGLSFLQEFYPKVMAYHRYLYKHRDPLEEGLVYIRHPYESGMCHSPVWDQILENMGESAPPTEEMHNAYPSLLDLFERHQQEDRAIARECPFLIQDPFFNAALVWSNEALVGIGSLLGEDVLEVIQWNELTIYGINEKLWDEEQGFYFPYDLRGEEPIRVPTISGLLPMIGEIPTQEQAEELLLLLESEHFGGQDPAIRLCPSYVLTAEEVAHGHKWRGSFCVFANWMLYRGLLRYDMEDMAARVRQHTLETLHEHGFWEHYDPRRERSAPGGGAAQHPTAAALLLDLLHLA